MTERLYLKDCYLKEFTAKIIDLTSNGVILDQTSFYPLSGGQLGDNGILKTATNSYEVLNTIQKQGNIIHELNSLEKLEIGQSIQGKLDWKQRYGQMRVHTAQHIISRYFQLNHNAETVSTHLKNTESRVDLHPIGKLSPENLSTISDEINEIFGRKMHVIISFLPREEAIEFLKEKEYQTKYLDMVPSSVKEFRIVSINDYDWAACAGTHVKNTAEIGKVSLNKTKNKGKLRERIKYSLIP